MMLEMIEANWIVVGAGVVALLLLVVWLILGRARKPTRRSFRPDVLDEGVAPAARNQALIDAAPAAMVPPPMAPPELIPALVREALVEIAPVQPESAHQADSALPPPPPPPTETPEPAAIVHGDDLSRIKGLGPKLVVILEGLGVTSFTQIAAWEADDLARIDPQLGAFAGRPARDSWVEQAKFLAADDVAGFEAKFGKV